MKSAWTHKKATYEQIQGHGEQTQSLLKNLKNVNSFDGAARNMVTGAEVPVSIVNGLLFSRVKCEQFIEKRLASREKGFYEPIKRSAIQITIKKRKIQKRYLFWRKIDRL